MGCRNLDARRSKRRRAAKGRLAIEVFSQLELVSRAGRDVLTNDIVMAPSSTPNPVLFQSLT